MQVICLMGKSSSGKSTLIKKIEDVYDIHNVKSYTTRSIREEDMNDANTHVFVDNKFWEDNNKLAIATYKSPKGYYNWTDINSFSKDKINIYAIDSICANDVFFPYCKKNNIQVYFVYLDIDEDERKKRYLLREGTLENFSEENHLDKKWLSSDTNTQICSSTDRAYCVISNIIEGGM